MRRYLVTFEVSRDAVQHHPDCLSVTGSITIEVEAEDGNDAELIADDIRDLWGEISEVKAVQVCPDCGQADGHAGGCHLAGQAA